MATGLSGLSGIAGIDFQRIMLTMLGLVGLYLVVTRPAALNDLIKTSVGGFNESLVILQGRNPRGTLR